MKTKRKTREELEFEIIALKAQLASTYHFASKQAGDANTKRYMGSAIIVAMKSLSGKEIVMPVAVRDGLSDEFIAAFKKEMARSHEIATLFKP